MVNFIGDGIGEAVADYAVSRGYYLQANSPHQPDGLASIFRRHAGRTKIVLEIENNGCRDATGPGLDRMADLVFGYGFPIDYLAVCQETLEETERAQAIKARLRSP
jgi:hypothetical protein